MEKNSNEEAERIIKSRLDKIQQMIREGKRATLWLEQEIGELARFPKEFSRIFSVLPGPSEKPSVWVWGGPYKDISEKMINKIGTKDWIWNIYVGPIGSGYYEYWHEYAATNISNVFVHRFSWTGDGWGGSRLLLSVNIEEKEFSSLGNIPKEVYQEKYREILEAIASRKPRTVLLKEKRYENWPGTESILAEILDRVFQKIPKWFSESKALSTETILKEKVYERFVHKIRTRYLNLTPIIEGKRVKADPDPGGIWEWLYDKTKFPDVYYHIVDWEYNFNEAFASRDIPYLHVVNWEYVLNKEMNPVVRWEFLTVNIPKEQFLRQ